MALINTKIICCDWEYQEQYFACLMQAVSEQVDRGELPCADPFNIFMMDFTPE